MGVSNRNQSKQRNRGKHTIPVNYSRQGCATLSKLDRQCTSEVKNEIVSQLATGVVVGLAAAAGTGGTIVAPAYAGTQSVPWSW